VTIGACHAAAAQRLDEDWFLKIQTFQVISRRIFLTVRRWRPSAVKKLAVWRQLDKTTQR